MLLPNNELKGVTRLVMGLLILLVLAQPLLSLYQLPRELVWSVPSFAVEGGQTDGQTDQVIANGLRLKKRWAAQFAARQQQNERQRITAVLRLIEGLTVREVDVQMEQGERKAVVVTVTHRSPLGGGKTDQAAITEKVSAAVQLVCAIPEEQVRVVWSD